MRIAPPGLFLRIACNVGTIVSPPLQCSLWAPKAFLRVGFSSVLAAVGSIPVVLGAGLVGPPGNRNRLIGSDCWPNSKALRPMNDPCCSAIGFHVSALNPLSSKCPTSSPKLV